MKLTRYLHPGVEKSRRYEQVPSDTTGQKSGNRTAGQFSSIQFQFNSFRRQRHAGSCPAGNQCSETLHHLRIDHGDHISAGPPLVPRTTSSLSCPQLAWKAGRRDLFWQRHVNRRAGVGFGARKKTGQKSRDDFILSSRWRFNMVASRARLACSNEPR